MKQEDLMLGDWYQWYAEDRYYNYRVVKNTFSLTEDTIDNFEPIPITPEILEKNGFVIKKKWAQMGNFGNNPLIMWHFEDEPLLHNFKHELEIHQNDTGKVHIRIPCEYVHQLQHALKLVNIEKEIVV